MRRLKLDGVLLLDKPVGPSSSAVLQAVKRLLGAEKAGHAGTLDPLASGLLPLLFGEATKFAQFGLDAAKEYVADVRLGSATDTGDAEGAVLEQRAVDVDQARLAQALGRFRGAIAQVPPMYSALKQGGRPCMRWRGPVRRGACRARSHGARTRAGFAQRRFAAPQDPLQQGHLRAPAGRRPRPGTGHGGHLAALRRTAVADLRLDQAIALDALQA